MNFDIFVDFSGKLRLKLKKNEKELFSLFHIVCFDKNWIFSIA